MSFKDTVEGTKRFGHFLNVLVKYQSLYFIKKDLSIWKKERKTEPETIKLILEEMGGAFVKLGQLLSLRPDLIPHEYCAELSKLQDSVKPFPFEDAKKIIESSMDRKMSEVFSEFDKKPIASASIGQVYKAKLKTGEKVAVKVKRPDADKVFEEDIALMGTVANMIKRIHTVELFDPQGIVEEFKVYTNDELNYDVEREKIDRFYKNLKNTGVKIPKTYPEFSSSKVLIMEFVEGHELKFVLDEKGFKEYKKRLAKELFASFLKQVMIDGEFHADPHPSNILVLPNSKEKKEKLALLDFGITGRLTPIMKANMVKLFVSLNNKDLEGIVTVMMNMNMVSSEDREIRDDMRNMLSPYYGAGLQKIDFPRLFFQSMKVARKHKLKIPKDYVLLGKAVLTVESVCAELYPEFNFVEESKPFVTKLMIHEYSPRKFIARQILRAEHVENLAKEIPSIISRLFHGDEEQNKRVEELSTHLLKAEHRIDVLIEKMMLMFVTLILLVAGFLMINIEPLREGISIYSICAFCMAAATFILAIVLNAKKSK